MSFKNILNERKVQLKYNDDIFGTLISKTVYSSYGIPLIYDLFNEKYRFLAYHYDNSDNEEFLFYIPLSTKEQEMVNYSHQINKLIMEGA